VVKRFLFALIAVAFIGATLPMACAGAAGMQNAVDMSTPCSDCPDHAPATDLAKMTCGALACAGIIGLPTRELFSLPNPGTAISAFNAAKEMVGISLAPDPFPPKSTVRV